MTRIKFFKDNLINVEHDINEFFRTNDSRVIDIKLNAMANGTIVAMVVYEEPGDYYSGGSGMC